MNIKKLRVYMTYITAAMVLSTSGCSKKDKTEIKPIITYQETEGQETIHYENIEDITITTTVENTYHVVISNETDTIREFNLTTEEELKEFLEKCTNLQAITFSKPKTAVNTVTFNEVILEKLPNKDQLKKIQIDQNVSNIEFLQEYKNLESLILTDANIQEEDLDILKDLHKLENLTLSKTNLETINALENLTKLKDLKLNNNPHLKGIEVLRNFQQLESLELGNTNVDKQDLEVLKALTNIKHLSLVGINFEDLTLIDHFKKLLYLDIQNTKVRDIDPVKQFSNLTVFKISNTDILDFTPLESLQELSMLTLNNTGLPNVDNLKNLYHLKSVELEYNNIEDITIFYTDENFKDLKSMKLKANKIPPEQIDLLWQAGKIGNEDAENAKKTQVYDLRAVKIECDEQKQMYKVKGVKEDNKIDFEIVTSKYEEVRYILKKCDSIEKIVFENLPNKQVKEFIEDIPYPENIQALQIQGTKIEEVYPYFKQLISLEQLVIKEEEGNIDITKMKANIPLEELKWLELSADNVNPISELQTLENLDLLSLKGENINNEDVRTLANIESLKYINLIDAPNVTNYAPLHKSNNLICLLEKNQISLCQELYDSKELTDECLWMIGSRELNELERFTQRIEYLRKALTLTKKADK